jgi:hypothetical protein
MTNILEAETAAKLQQCASTHKHKLGHICSPQDIFLQQQQPK